MEVEREEERRRENGEKRGRCRIKGDGKKRERGEGRVEEYVGENEDGRKKRT